MMSKKISSLKTQLIISLSMILLCVDIGIAFLSYHDALTEVEELFDAQLAQSARVLAGTFANEMQQWQEQKNTTQFPLVYNSWTPVIKGITDRSQQALPQGHRYESKIAFQLWSPEKKLWVYSLSTPNQTIPFWQPGFHTMTHDGVLWRIFVLPIPHSGARMITAENQEVRGELSSDIASHLIWGHLIGLPLVIFLISFIVTRAFKPVESLGAQIKKRHINNLDPISVDNAPGEVYPLVEALNTLLQRLKLSWQQQKEFIADAAHELRTPLAALKVHAQNLTASQTLAEAKESTDYINQGVDRCNKLVQQLLTLARQEQGHLIVKEKIVLTPLLREIISQQLPLALKKHQIVELDAVESLSLQTHRESLRVLMGNLLSNAIQYTPIGGRIFCAAQQNENQITITVEDDGPGIPEEEREKIFQRFYRITRPYQAEGTGLGLAICQKITEQLQGRLTISAARQTQGACFTLTLPTELNEMRNA